ncbi:hypothetical protein HDV05_006772 [Chytridiales sp. JEL 0842]|nr:hypothetical protein HDV05_006772 [Chytridiales sp. JEL 0842]
MPPDLQATKTFSSSSLKDLKKQPSTSEATPTYPFSPTRPKEPATPAVAKKQPSTDPPKAKPALSKQNSQASFHSHSNGSAKPKQQQRKPPRPKPMPVAVAMAANFEEVARLTSVVDSLKAKLREYEEERKTMKIVNKRQDLALQKMDKEQTSLPLLVQSLNNELKVVKSAHAGCAAKIAIAEKSSAEHIEETLRLQKEVSKLTQQLKSRHLDEMENMKVTISTLQDTLIVKDAKIEDLNRKLKNVENEKNWELRETKSKLSKLNKEFEDLKKQHDLVVAENEERGKKIAVLQIYTNTQHKASRPGSIHPRYEEERDDVSFAPLMEETGSQYHGKKFSAATKRGAGGRSSKFTSPVPHYGRGQSSQAVSPVPPAENPVSRVVSPAPVASVSPQPPRTEPPKPASPPSQPQSIFKPNLMTGSKSPPLVKSKDDLNFFAGPVPAAPAEESSFEPSGEPVSVFKPNFGTAQPKEEAQLLQPAEPQEGGGGYTSDFEPMSDAEN